MALIPPFFLDCVVSIGTKNNDKTDWIASGFFYGEYRRRIDANTREYSVYLVTNRHVLKDLESIVVRINPKTNEAALEYNMDLFAPDKRQLWFQHPDSKIDVAIIPINYERIKDMQVSFFRSDLNAANIEKMKELGVSEGDFAYVLGFPMGIVGDYRSSIIARNATIARIRDVLSRANHEYLIDALIFPGNSGGPVVLKPEIVSITGTKSSNQAFLIGIVHAYMPYNDVAISQQTQRPKVIFEENSGLALVHTIDAIEETIKEQMKLQNVQE